MAVILRDVKEADLQKIMDWRMRPDITKWMNTDPELTLEGQKKWLESINTSESDRMWMIVVDDVDAGIINLQNIDWGNKTTSWGWYIGENSKRSLKLAISLEASLYEYCFNTLGFKAVSSETFSENAAVIKIHQACGCHIVEVVQGEVIKTNRHIDVTHVTITYEEWQQIRTRLKYNEVLFGRGGEIRVHHIGYATADTDAAIRDFHELGFDNCSNKITDESRNAVITFLSRRDSDWVVELVEPFNERSPASGYLKFNKNAALPYHICYSVQNVYWQMNVLHCQGWVIVKKPETAVAIAGKKVAFLFKKNSGLIELVEE